MSARAGIPRWGWLVGGLLVAAWVTLVISSTRRPDTTTFTPRIPAPREVPAGWVGPDTATLDARAEDRWVRYDLARRRVAAPGEPWDLAVRRHRLLVNGAALRVERPFDDVMTLPDTGWVATRATADGDSITPPLERWYTYGFFSHVLEPAPVTFGLRLTDGRRARFHILSYYCPGPEAGCMTIAWVHEGAP